jgi:hypothetical protein
VPIVHVVRPGECLSSIAKQHGFRDYRIVYDHPDNASLKAKRRNPNILHPGDEVVIPDKELKEVPVATTALHRFVVKSHAKVLRLRLLAHGHEPVADQPFELEVDHRVIRGRTDGQGGVEQPLPIGVREGLLRVAGRTLRLRLGALNPLRDTADEGVTGAQARLHNLGFDAGASDGIAGVRTRAALGILQAEERLPITAQLDAATVSALERRYGS